MRTSMGVDDDRVTVCVRVYRSVVMSGVQRLDIQFTVITRFDDERKQMNLNERYGYCQITLAPRSVPSLYLLDHQATLNVHTTPNFTYYT